MKKLLIITAVLVLAIVNTKAQGQPGSPPSSEEMLKTTMAGLTKEVSLTDEEKSSVKEIFTEFYSEMDKMFKSGSRPDPSNMQTLESKRDKKVKEVLSEEKYKAYSEYMKNNMRGPQGPPPGN